MFLLQNNVSTGDNTQKGVSGFEELIAELKRFIDQETRVSWLPEANEELKSLALEFAESPERRTPYTNQIKQFSDAFKSDNSQNLEKAQNAAVARLVYLSTHQISKNPQLNEAQKSYLMALIQDCLLKSSLRTSAIMLCCSEDVLKILQSIQPKTDRVLFKKPVRNQYIQHNRELYGQVDINIFMRIWHKQMGNWQQTYQDHSTKLRIVQAHEYFEDVDEMLKKFKSKAGSQKLYKPSIVTVDHFSEMVEKYNQEHQPFDHPLAKLPILTSAEIWQKALNRCLENCVNGQDINEFEALNMLYYLGTGLANFLNFDFRGVYEFFYNIHKIKNQTTDKDCVISAFRTTSEIFCDTPHVASNRKAATYTNVINVWKYIERHIGDSDFLDVLLNSGPINPNIEEHLKIAEGYKK